MQSLQSLNPLSLVLADGEQYKSLHTLNRIFTRLLEKKFSRDACLVALGGGVIGDLTGFAAACYQRGIDFIQLPTTILAQVDSSVGGKTGVNHVLGKNMIGAFHQPKAVIIDTSVLETLSDREFNAGLAEVIKYGIIRDLSFFDWLEKNLVALQARKQESLAYIVEHSCKNKAEVVAQDEREAGTRAILNFGHTFGHAIETGTAYSTWLHGEAIAVGMLMAADLSQRLGWLAKGDTARIKGILQRLNFPSMLPPELSPAQMLELMSVDKKVRAGQLFLILLKGIGEAILTDQFDIDILSATLQHFAAGSKHTGR